MPVTARFLYIRASSVLYIRASSAKMYLGESQHTKGRLKDNGKEKQEGVSFGSESTYSICAVDGVSVLC